MTLEGQPGSVLVARSVPVEGQCLCALALIGDAAASDDGYWDAETRASAQAVAAIVATQIRHANDMEALAERQVLTRALIAGAPVAMLAMDADVRLIEFNPAAERLSGYRRGDVLGRPMPEILVPERDRPRFLEHIKTYLATGDPEEFTGQLRVAILRADGTERVAGHADPDRVPPAGRADPASGTDPHPRPAAEAGLERPVRGGSGPGEVRRHAAAPQARPGRRGTRRGHRGGPGVRL